MEYLLPDWAPNLHPLMVHFPIAILIAATLADLAGVIWPRPWLKKAVLGLFIFGVPMLLLTYLSGKQAIDVVEVPLKGQMVASQHANWALNTLIFYGIYLVVRLALNFTGYAKRKWVAIILLLAGLAGIGFMAKTADLGGQLVYQHGVGVQQESN